MYFIDTRSFYPSQGNALVLRIVNKGSGYQRSRVLPGHSIWKLREVDLPEHPVGNIVVWLEERTPMGNTPITARIALGKLSHLGRLAAWMSDFTSAFEASDVADRCDLLLGWAWIRPQGSDAGLHRIYRDIWAMLTRKRVPAAQSRIRALTRAYGEATGYSDKSDVTEVMFSLSCLLVEFDLYRGHSDTGGHMPGDCYSQRSESKASGFFPALFAYLEYLSGYSHLSAASMHSGHILSYLGKRQEAADFYRNAIEINATLVNRGAAEIGAHTYRSLGKSEQVPEASKIRFHDGVEGSGSSSSRLKVTIVYSANIAFLRKYISRVFFYASSQSMYRYHFHLVDGYDECIRFIREAESLLRSMISMNGSNVCLSVTWSHEPAPENVSDLKTYFACARFIHAREIAERYGSDVWIQDVDLYPTGPTDIFQAALDAFDVTFNHVRILHGLVPWKRFLAGSVYVKNNLAGRSFLDESSRYIRAFLDSSVSWTLDQNALDWAVEATRGHVMIGDGSSIGLPLTQSAMSNYIER